MLTSQLVEIQPEIPDAILDIRYATENNFTGGQIYDEPHALLLPEPLEALKKAAEMFRANDMVIVIFDAWRPDEAHEELKKACPDPRYVSPTNRHGSGRIVDASLANPDGTYIDMGTEYDYFGPESNPYYTRMSADRIINRRTLIGSLAFYGFKVHPEEWWDHEYAPQ